MKLFCRILVRGRRRAGETVSSTAAQVSTSLSHSLSSPTLSLLLEKYEIYRLQLKDIRNKQEELQALYNKQEKIGKSLKDAHKKNKPTDALTEELANLEITVGHTEADLFFIKRKSLHTGLMMQFEGMKELASKVRRYGRLTSKGERYREREREREWMEIYLLLSPLLSHLH